MNNDNDVKTIIKSDLLERGWTSTMVKKFYPTPYKVKKRMGGGQINYYLLSEVEKIEKTESFKESLEKSEIYKERGEKANNTKLNNIIQKIEPLIEAFIVPKYDYERLKEEAMQSREAHLMDKGIYSMNELSEEREKILISNYIRHELTDYDYLLHEYEGQPFYYETIRDRIEEKIKAVYPFYTRNKRPDFPPHR